MSRGGDCGCGDVLTCVCSVEDSPCFAVTGKGSTAKSFSLAPILDAAADNMAECNPSGLGAFLPSLIADPPRARMKKIRTQTIPTSTPTLVTFDTERWDSAGMVDVEERPGRMDIVQDGLYLVNLVIGFREPIAEAFISCTVLNQPSQGGIITDARYILPALGDPYPRLSVSGSAQLELGNYLVCQVFQNTGYDMLLVGAELSARYVAPRT